MEALELHNRHPHDQEGDHLLAPTSSQQRAESNISRDDDAATSLSHDAAFMPGGLSTSTASPLPPSIAPTSSGPASVASAKTKATSRNDLCEWKSEIAATIISVVFLLALVGTLLHLNHNPLPGWSLNSLISLYSVIFKSCMVYVVASAIAQRQWAWFKKERLLHDVVLYDEAQDFLGAIRWLFLKRFSEPLTALGAMIILVAVLIDPFIQQLIQYNNCSINLSQAATIPRTNYFNPGMIHDGPLSMTPLPDEETAYSSGLFSSPPEIEFACSTGNCTYATEYTTVGYCTSCQDISQNINISCNDTAPVFTLPSGLTIDQRSQSGQRNVLRMRITKDENFEILSGSSGCGKGNRDLNTGGQMAGCDGSAATNDVWKCRGYGAASCSIGPCIKTMQASVESGTIIESFHEETGPNEYWGSKQPLTDAIVDSHCISESDKSRLLTNGYKLDDKTRWLGYNLTYDPGLNFSAPLPNTSFPLSMVTNDCLYLIKHQFVTGYQQYFLYQLLSGTVNGSFGSAGTMVAYNGPQLLQHLYNFGYNDFDWINSILQNATTALTNHIRQNGVAIMSKSATGEMHHFATCIEIQWPWIALPAALSGISILLLGLSIWSSRRDGLPVWKSSPLAYLLHGKVQLPATMTMPPTIVPTATPVCQSMDEMKIVSKTMLAQLDTSGDTTALISTGSNTLVHTNWMKRSPFNRAANGP